jgi:hypothetical protein
VHRKMPAWFGPGAVGKGSGNRHLANGLPVFSDDAVRLIHATSRGYPRTVNNLAVQALLAAYADNKAVVDESCARTAATEVTTPD